jgi:hypothetical protein
LPVLSLCLLSNAVRGQSDRPYFITTVAGGGKGLSSGSNGYGGLATDALLYSPWGAAFDKAGNLYVGDSVGNRVRKVSPSGTITTVAGTGGPNAGGNPSMGDGGLATKALLSGPSGVVVAASGISPSGATVESAECRPPALLPRTRGSATQAGQRRPTVATAVRRRTLNSPSLAA